jgi:hypothetical protein
MNQSVFLRALAFGLALSSAQLASAGKEKAMPGLLIKSGETWIFHLENGQPTNPRPATEADKPGKDELKASLSSRMGALLTISNNTSQLLNYRAFITPKPGKKGTPTSVCTLLSNGRGAFENWQNAIPAIRIADFTPAQEGQMVCK